MTKTNTHLNYVTPSLHIVESSTWHNIDNPTCLHSHEKGLDLFAINKPVYDFLNTFFIKYVSLNNVHRKSLPIHFKKVIRPNVLRILYSVSRLANIYCKAFVLITLFMVKSSPPKKLWRKTEGAELSTRMLRTFPSQHLLIIKSCPCIFQTVLCPSIAPIAWPFVPPNFRPHFHVERENEVEWWALGFVLSAARFAFVHSWSYSKHITCGNGGSNIVVSKAIGVRVPRRRTCCW